MRSSMSPSYTTEPPSTTSTHSSSGHESARSRVAATTTRLSLSLSLSRSLSLSLLPRQSQISEASQSLAGNAPGRLVTQPTFPWAAQVLLLCFSTYLREEQQRKKCKTHTHPQEIRKVLRFIFFYFWKKKWAPYGDRRSPSSRCSRSRSTQVSERVLGAPHGSEKRRGSDDCVGARAFLCSASFGRGASAIGILFTRYTVSDFYGMMSSGRDFKRRSDGKVENRYRKIASGCLRDAKYLRGDCVTWRDRSCRYIVRSLVCSWCACLICARFPSFVRNIGWRNFVGRLLSELWRYLGG